MATKKPFAFEVEAMSPRFVQARVGKRVIGKASAWVDSLGRFTILNVAVREDYRKRGVARAMYARLEADAGQLLVPAISTSDLAFEFWKRYRPDAVADDLRHRRDELLGRKVRYKGCAATIVTVGSGNVTARYDEGTERFGMETCLSPARLAEALVL